MGWGVHDYPEPKEKPSPVCPVCGEECTTYYLDFYKQVVGCDICIMTVDADEYSREEFSI